MLSKLAKSDEAQYQSFWDIFGNVLKEGPGEDFTNREKIAELMRFASTHTDESVQNVSLKQYVERMQDGQDAIYYVVADNHVTAKNSPHIEVFRKKGIEVLLLSDRIDDWLMGHLNEFDGKALKDIAKGELDLGESTEEEKAELEAAKTENEGLLDRLKTALDGRVSEVRPTLRLTDSPACLVVGEHELGAQMRRILEAAGQALPDSEPILEVNTSHGLVKRMDGEQDEDRFADLALILLDQATLAQGSQLEDPASYVARMNKLLVEMSA
jgi:molecular chaperone HtpG